MTREEVKSCFEYLKSLGLISATSFVDDDYRFYAEDLDSIQWIARYEHLYKRFKVVSAIETEGSYPYRILTYNARIVETPYHLEVMVKQALTLLDDARKARGELIKERKTKRIKSAAKEWRA